MPLSLFPSAFTPGPETEHKKLSPTELTSGAHPFHDFTFRSKGPTPPGFDNQHQHCFAHAFGDKPLPCTSIHHVQKRRWRSEGATLVAEFVGTFSFLFTAYLASQSANSRPISVTDTPREHSNYFYVAFAFGASYAASLGLFQRWTVGLYNPVMPLILLCVRKLRPMRALLLISIQLCASLVAAGLARSMLPHHSSLSAETTLAEGMNVLQGFWLEVLFTFLLTSALLSLTKHKLPSESLGRPAAMGTILFIAEMATLPYTGGGLNPFRAFAPAAVDRKFPTYHWIYWIGPLLGSLLSAAGYWLTCSIAGGADDDSPARCTTAEAPLADKSPIYTGEEGHSSSYFRTWQPPMEKISNDLAKKRPISHVSTHLRPEPRRKYSMPFSDLRPPPLAVAPTNRPYRAQRTWQSSSGEPTFNDDPEEKRSKSESPENAERSFSIAPDSDVLSFHDEERPSRNVKQLPAANPPRLNRTNAPSLWVRSSPLDLAAILDAQNFDAHGAHSSKDSEGESHEGAPKWQRKPSFEVVNELHHRSRSASVWDAPQLNVSRANYAHHGLEQLLPGKALPNGRKRSRSDSTGFKIRAAPSFDVPNPRCPSVSPISFAASSSAIDPISASSPRHSGEFVGEEHAFEFPIPQVTPRQERRLSARATQEMPVSSAPPSSWGQNKRSSMRRSRRTRHGYENSRSRVEFTRYDSPTVQS